MAWSKLASNDYTEITGLIAAAGDGSGAWNTVDLSLLVDVPADATGVILWIFNTTSSGRWAGVRTPGKSNAVIGGLLTRAQTRYIVAALDETDIEIYTENTTALHFYIMGFTGPETVFFDIDAGLPTIPNNASSYAATDFSSFVPEGAVAALMSDTFAGVWRSDGVNALSGTESLFRGMALIPLPSNRVQDLYTAQSHTVYGYLTGGVEFTSWPPDPESVTNDNTWRDYPVLNADSSFVFVAASRASTNDNAAIRANGSSISPLDVYGTQHSYMYAPTASDGSVEYRGEVGTTVWYTIAWLTADSGDENLSILVDSSDIAIQSFDVGLQAQEAYVLPVTYQSLAFEGQDIPFILTNPGAEGQIALAGQNVSLLAAAVLPIDIDTLATEGQDISLRFGGNTSIPIDSIDLAISVSNVNLVATGLSNTAENIVSTLVRSLARSLSFSLTDIGRGN